MPGPRAVQNLQMPHSRDWQDEQIPCSSPGGGGGGGSALLELTDVLFLPIKMPGLKTGVENDIF